MREPLDGFEQEALEAEAGLALVVLLPEESNKLGLLLDGLLQNLHCLGEVIDVLAVVLDHLLAVELRGGVEEVGGGRREVERKDVGTEKRVGGSISNPEHQWKMPILESATCSSMNTRN